LSRQWGVIASALRSAGLAGLTTMELLDRTRIANATRRVREMRAAGWGIENRYERTTKDGGKVFRYRLLSEPQEGTHGLNG